MIATKMRFDSDLYIVLVFDDGSYAVHHGLMVWATFDADGLPTGQFDSHCGEPHNKMEGSIHTYCMSHTNELGRITL